jgi:hypothetical protein
VETLTDFIDGAGYYEVGDSETKKLSSEQLEKLLDTKAEDPVMKLEGRMPFGTNPKLEEWLQSEGIPFKRWSEPCDDFPSEMVVFDGVRIASLTTDAEGNAMVDMRALRSIIDMLENDDELRALAYANSHWVETNVENMFRYGMEDVKEIIHDGAGSNQDDIIDVVPEEE